MYKNKSPGALSEDNGEENNNNRSKDFAMYKKVYFVHNVHLMIFFGCFLGVMDMQDKVQMSKVLGMNGMYIHVCLAVTSSVLITPFILGIIGPKLAMIIGEFFMVLYLAANIKPYLGTIISAAVLFGIFESFMYASAFYITALCAIKIYENKPAENNHCFFNLNKSQTIATCFCLSYVFQRFGEVIGKLISYIVFVEEKSIESSFSFNSDNSTYSNEAWSKCGSNFCPKIQKGKMSTQKLPVGGGIYVFIGVALFLQLSATIFIAKALPFLPSSTENVQSTRKNYWQAFIGNIKSTIIFLVKKENILLNILIASYGVYMAYSLPMVNQGLVACALGPSKTMFSIVIYSIAGLVGSILSLRLIIATGRLVFMTLVAVLCVSMYIVILAWEPSSAWEYFLFVLVSVFGIVDVAWFCIIQASVAIYFEREMRFAYSMQKCIFGLPRFFAMLFGMSACVQTKSVVVITLALCSALSYGILVKVQKKKIRSTTEEDK